jgi:hypothetical protein
MAEVLTAYVVPDTESSGVTGDGVAWYMRNTHEVLAVLDAEAGPCETCDKPMVRVKVRRDVDHNGYRYPMTLEFVHLHADGSEPHDGKIVNCVKPRCGACGEYGTVTVRDTGYGDETNCSACGSSTYYDRGD